MSGGASCLVLFACLVVSASSAAGTLEPKANTRRDYSTANGLASLYTPTVTLENRAAFDERVRSFIDRVESQSRQRGETNSSRSLRLWQEANRSDRYDPMVSQRLMAIATERANLVEKYQLVYAFLKKGAVGDPKSLPEGRVAPGGDISWSNGKVLGNYGAGAIYYSLDIPVLVYEAADGLYQVYVDVGYGINRYKAGQETLTEALQRLSKHIPIPSDDPAGRQQVNAGYSWAATASHQDRLRRVLSLSRGEEKGGSSTSSRASTDKHASNRNQRGSSDGRSSSRDRGDGFGAGPRGDWDRQDRGSGGDEKMAELDFSDDPFIIDLNEPSGTD